MIAWEETTRGADHPAHDWTRRQIAEDLPWELRRGRALAVLAVLLVLFTFGIYALEARADRGGAAWIADSAMAGGARR